ncbi:serine/threonine-protein kinase [Nonomuraea sp. SBT364]|uniref:serine/threonine-protein kinase n=1 Tax=Nonomuraea sp. SBT364 TaxID=1580530 RepID=UPI0009E75347|nr:serine/threonine-protein kinase [Nonomuraea sp. SBT364]
MSELRADDPRQLGAYRLSGRLGQGGQGVVYLGHADDGAKVAVKLLHASLSADPVVRRRFLAEVEALRRVAPFCTAQLLDADLEGDRPYLVSEYVDGVSLGEHVLAAGPRAGGSLHRLAIGTATALGAIHRAGVVHRDFKPGNVLLSLDGPRVIDFGVSRLADGTATTGIIPMGTPAYLSPERIEGLPAGPAADLYAWGLTVAYTATGRHAFAGGTHQEVLARILYGRPDLGSLSGRLRGIVDACLAPDPADRPDAEEVLRLLLGQDMAGDVLTSGAMAAVDTTGDTGAAAEPAVKTLAWRMPDTTGPTTDPATDPAADPATGPQTTDPRAERAGGAGGSDGAAGGGRGLGFRKGRGGAGRRVRGRRLRRGLPGRGDRRLRRPVPGVGRGPGDRSPRRGPGAGAAPAAVGDRLGRPAGLGRRGGDVLDGVERRDRRGGGLDRVGAPPGGRPGVPGGDPAGRRVTHALGCGPALLGRPQPDGARPGLHAGRRRR